MFHFFNWYPQTLCRKLKNKHSSTLWWWPDEDLYPGILWQLFGLANCLIDLRVPARIDVLQTFYIFARIHDALMHLWVKWPYNQWWMIILSAKMQIQSCNFLHRMLTPSLRYWVRVQAQRWQKAENWRFRMILIKTCSSIVNRVLVVIGGKKKCVGGFLNLVADLRWSKPPEMNDIIFKAWHIWSSTHPARVHGVKWVLT